MYKNGFLILVPEVRILSGAPFSSVRLTSDFNLLAFFVVILAAIIQFPCNPLYEASCEFFSKKSRAHPCRSTYNDRYVIWRRVISKIIFRFPSDLFS